MNQHDVLEIIKPILIKDFSAELCNRFDAIVPFQPLKKEHIPGVISVSLTRIAERLAKHSMNLFWDQKVINYFNNTDFDPSFGMRGFCRKIDDEVKHALKEAVDAKQKLLEGDIILTVKQQKIFVRELKKS